MNIPNLLSCFRILLIPCFIVAFFSPSPYGMLIAGIICVVSGLTDLLDGYIARKFNMITELGKILDPAADKLTQISVVICLLIADMLPLWLVLVWCVKDLLMMACSAAAVKSSFIPIGARWYGKAATIVFYIAVCVMILLRGVLSSLVITILTYAIIITTLVSALLYLCYALRLLREHRQHPGEPE